MEGDQCSKKGSFDQEKSAAQANKKPSLKETFSLAQPHHSILSAQAGTIRYPRVHMKLTLGQDPSLYRSVRARHEPMTVHWTWGVKPIEEGPCLAEGKPAPLWFKNATFLHAAVLPDYLEGAGRRGIPYLVALERFTQVGQTAEVRHGCRRAIAQIEHRLTSVVEPAGEFDGFVTLDGGPLGPIQFRARLDWDSDYEQGPVGLVNEHLSAVQRRRNQAATDQRWRAVGMTSCSTSPDRNATARPRRGNTSWWPSGKCKRNAPWSCPGCQLSFR